MTTYSFTVELSEQELWSVEEALKFYISPQATQLRIDQPELVKYSGVGHIHKILDSKKLYGQPELTSTSSFVFSGDMQSFPPKKPTD